MTEDANEPPKNARRKALGCLVATLVVCVGSGFAVSRRLGARVEEGRRVTDRVAHEIQRHGARAWHRPVLRGAPEPGNAAEQARSVLERLRQRPGRSIDVGLLDRAFTAMNEGREMPEGLDALMRATEADQRELRRATQHAFAAYPMRARESDDRPERPEHPMVWLHETKLILVHTQLEQPRDCMASAADTIRLGQDLSAGSNLVARMMLDAMARRAAPVLLRCASRASAGDLAAARAEVERLAAHSPPAAWSFEMEALGMARMMTTALPDDPWPTNRERVEGLSMLEASMGAIDHQIGVATRWRSRRTGGFAALVRGAEDEDRRLARSDNPLVSIASLPMANYVRRASRVDAILRALVLALDALESGRRESTTLPDRPARIREPALSDPLAATPLRWTRDPDGRRATIAWTPSAPGRPADEDSLVVALPPMD